MRTSPKASVLQDLDRLFQRGIAASGMALWSIDSWWTGTKRRLKRWSHVTVPWFAGSAGACLSTRMTLTMPSRRPFSSWCARRGNCAIPIGLDHGSTVWRGGSRPRLVRGAPVIGTNHWLKLARVKRPRTEWLDVMPILDAELGRLPAKHRDVLILCLMNGASPEEAAVQLGCPVGTVKSRLARGREALRGRLTTRGIAPAIALAAVSSQEIFASPVPPMLARATLEMLDSTSIAPGILALTKGVFSEHAAQIHRDLIIVTGGSRGRWPWYGDMVEFDQRAGGSTRSREPRSGSSRRSTSEVQTSNNMKQILLAFHNYLLDQRVLSSAGELRERWSAEAELAGRPAAIPRRE